MQKPKFIFGLVKSIEEDGLVIDIKDTGQEGFCSWKELSDHQSNWKKLSIIGIEYCFCVLREPEVNGKVPLSYRFTHPEEQKTRRRIIPTASHFLNLNKFIFTAAAESDMPNSKIKLVSFKDLLKQKFSDNHSKKVN